MAETAEKQPTEPKRPKQGRSPAYPAITLETAIAKAKALFEAEGKYAVPMPSAFKAWGFGEKSSGGRDARAALKYFGLISLEGEGETGKVKLTEDALRILVDEREDQTEKKTIIRQLALAPSVHKKLLEQFPEGIKSDASAEHFLFHEAGFNKQAASEVVAEFKATADYAELYKPAISIVKDPASNEKNDQFAGNQVKSGEEGRKSPLKPKPREVKAGMKEDVFTLREGDVVLQWPEGLSTESLEEIEDWMKLILRKIKRTAQFIIPGSPEAIERGCICGAAKKADGTPLLSQDGKPLYAMEKGCPVHG